MTVFVSHDQFWVTKHGPLAFSVAKGYSPACDALRDSLLLVAAVHLRYLSPNEVGDPTYIQRLRHRTVGQIKKVIADGEQGEDELILCALLSCAVSCVRLPHLYLLWNLEALTLIERGWSDSP